MNFFLPRTLKHKVIVSFILIMTLAIANVFSIKYMLQQSDAAAISVNTAGKLRMLSQRIGLEALALRLIPEHERPAGSNYENDFDLAYKALKKGGFAFGQYVPALQPQHQALLESINNAWSDFNVALNILPKKSFVSPDPTRNINNDYQRDQAADRLYAVSIANSSDELLYRTDILVSKLVDYSIAVQGRMINIAYLLLIINILIISTGYIVLRKYFISPIKQLLIQCQQLAIGNYSARSNLIHNDEMSILGRALNDSAENVEKLLSQVSKERKALKQANDIFKGLSNNSITGIYMLNENLTFSYVNHQLADMVGYTIPELTDNFYFTRLLPAQNIENITNQMLLCLSGSSKTARCEITLVQRNKSTINVEVFCSYMIIDRKPTLVGIMLDITERKLAQESARRAQLVYKHTSDAMVITDTAGKVIDINPAFTTITGYTANDIIGKNMSSLSSSKQDRSFYKDMWQKLHETGSWEGDICNIKKNGEEYIEHLRINTSYNADGSVNCRIGLFSDVTDKRREEEIIWRQAHFDSLTSLPNRQMFYEYLSETIVDSKENDQIFALLFLDLDDFKEVNDTFGHEEGDELLRIVARRLKGCLRPADHVARLGGDEFTIVVKGLKDPNNIHTIANKILTTISKPYSLNQNTVTISVSIGVAFYPHDSGDSTELLKRADLAMYASKKNGRNQYCVFSAVMLKDVEVRRDLMHELNKAIKQQEFVLYYQPIINMQTDKIQKAEALIRWQHPERGLISPLDFISLAEETGQIIPIGDWVFKQASKQVALWREKYIPNLSISINVSPVQFNVDGLDANEWINDLMRLNLPASAIVAEITEGLLIEVNKETRERLMTFKNAGLNVALDDFGTGYSSLSHLKQLDIDYLKIDRSFIRNLKPNSEDLALCQGIIVMAHQLGMKVIAEGVSSEEQHNLLKEAGCDFGQGFWYDKPMPVESFENLLENLNVTT